MCPFSHFGRNTSCWRGRPVGLHGLQLRLAFQFMKYIDGKPRATVTVQIGLVQNVKFSRAIENIAEHFLIITSAYRLFRNCPDSASNILRLQLPFTLAVAAKYFLPS